MVWGGCCFPFGIAIIVKSLQTVRLNSLASGRCDCNFKFVIFKLIPWIDILSISCEIAIRWMPLDLPGDQSNFGSGNDLVPSDTKPLPEPMLTQIYVHWATTSRYVVRILLAKAETVTAKLNLTWAGKVEASLGVKPISLSSWRFRGINGIHTWAGSYKIDSIPVHLVILPVFQSH